MHAHGDTSKPRWLRLVAGVVIVLALVLAVVLVVRALRMPSSDAASIDAEVVHVASEVGGRLIDLRVKENQQVTRGQVLYRLDPEPYANAVAQARADLALAEALLATQQRAVSSQASVAVVASGQTRKARENANLAARTVTRLRPLARDGYVPEQRLDMAQVAASDAARSLAQAQEQEAASAQAVDTTDGAQATVQARRAALAIAERALAQTTVLAPHDGRIVGLSVASGEMVLPAQSLFTLISTEQWFAVANFRETALEHIKDGQCATVYSMIDRSQPMRGQVIGIGHGVLDTEKVGLPRQMPYVERSLNWVRVAQRFPVRVALKDPPEALMRVGASAVVEVGDGPACR